MGAAAFPVWVAWKPKLVDPPGGTWGVVADVLRRTAPLAGLIVAFHALVTVCPDGRVNPSDQPLMAAVPVFVTVRFSVSPVFQALTASVTVTCSGPAGSRSSKR